MTRIAVLGGGTPFSAGLLAALATAGSGDRLTLWGGEPSTLALLADHGRRILGPFGGGATACAGIEEALEGADVVVHQVRYGRMAGRATGEDIARRYGVPADETLGPGGLLAALLIAEGLPPVADALVRHAPGVPVVAMTNPLSVTVALFHERGVPVIGCCELPEETARAAAVAAGARFDPAGWHTTGLNHRGFVHRLTSGGRDLLPGLADRLAADGHTTAAADVAELGAVPTKYHRLVQGRWAPGPSRAGALTTAREHLLADLRADPSTTPASLGERPTPWYPDALLPLVGALTGGPARRVAVTLPGVDGLAREQLCQVAGDAIEVEDAPPAPPAVRRWLDIFDDHERAVLAAVRSPDATRLRAAVAADPCVPPAVAGDCASAVGAVLGA